MPDIAEYCRELETYLCRKNGGHLIRIVGPAFERVKGWAEQGVPLALALRGVDRCCERVRARSARARPVRIEFCEADILALFDDWRRAIGAAGADPAPPPARKPGLGSHVERAIQRLLAVQTAAGRSTPFAAELERAVRELDSLVERARHARGSDRSEIIDRLTVLDRALLSAAAAELDPSADAQLRADAEAELAPFAARMSPDARSAALDAAFERLLREMLKLPAISYQ